MRILSLPRKDIAIELVNNPSETQRDPVQDSSVFCELRRILKIGDTLPAGHRRIARSQGQVSRDVYFGTQSASLETGSRSFGTRIYLQRSVLRFFVPKRISGDRRCVFEYWICVP